MPKQNAQNTTTPSSKTDAAPKSGGFTPITASTAAQPRPIPSEPYPRGDLRAESAKDGTDESTLTDTSADEVADKAFEKLFAEEGGGSGENDADPDADEGQGQSDQEDDLWATAKAELKKGKWPDKAIEALSKKEALDLAEHARKMSRDFSKLAGENGGLKSALEKLKRSQGAVSGDASQAAATTQPAIDEKAFEPFLQELGEKAGKPALDAFRRMHGENISLRSQLDGLKAQVDLLNGITRNALVKDARSRLTKDLPQLADEDAFERVQTRMSSLAATGEFGDATELMRAAAMIEFADDLLASRKEAESQTQRRNGKMSTPKSTTPKNTATRAQRSEDALNAAFDAVMLGKPQAEVAAIFRAHAQ